MGVGGAVGAGAAGGRPVHSCPPAVPDWAGPCPIKILLPASA